ncbi:MAG: glycosyltransferase, partial [Deltaproteobacteria bacterium]|nr:glycosyltransferase [Deltaproteobacteria bacterium]
MKNEENNLQRCLDSILLSAGTNVDVHVFDDCSTDRTAEILQEYADRHDNIHAHKGFGKGPAIIRNYFLEEVTNPYIIFVDGDIEVQSNWYQEIERSISKMSDTIVAIGGAQKIPHISKGLEKFHGALLESFSFLSDHIQQASDFVEVKHNPLCNVIYKTQPLKDVQGFDEHLFPGEDLDMDIRLYRNGYKFLYNPEMVVYHHRPDTIKEFQTMLIKYGKT